MSRYVYVIDPGNFAVPDGVDPAHITTVCAAGEHSICAGKVAADPKTTGYRYTRCECPTCDHPQPRLMPIAHDED